MRFKTKQELKRDNPTNPTRGTTCPYLGEPAGSGAITYHHTDMFTDEPHPYEGKSFKIKVTPEESEKVQKKAFKLGYKWFNSREKTIKQTDAPFLFLDDDMGISCMTIGDQYFKDHEYTELTPQQFLDGDLPETWLQTSENEFLARLGVSKTEKPDAYIDAHCNPLNIVSWREGRQVTTCDLKLAYLYNLMSEEEFKKKHPPVLKFKDWIVKAHSDTIQVHCPGYDGILLSKKHIQGFMKVADLSGGQGANTPSLDEVYNFIHKHKKELGL